MVQFRVLEGSRSGARRKHSSPVGNDPGLELIDCRPDLYESLKAANRPSAFKRAGLAILFVAAASVALFLAF